MQIRRQDSYFRAQLYAQHRQRARRLMRADAERDRQSDGAKAAFVRCLSKSNPFTIDSVCARDRGLRSAFSWDPLRQESFVEILPKIIAGGGEQLSELIQLPQGEKCHRESFHPNAAVAACEFVQNLVRYADAVGKIPGSYSPALVSGANVVSYLLDHGLNLYGRHSNNTTPCFM